MNIGQNADKNHNGFLKGVIFLLFSTFLQRKSYIQILIYIPPKTSYSLLFLLIKKILFWNLAFLRQNIIFLRSAMSWNLTESSYPWAWSRGHFMSHEARQNKLIWIATLSVTLCLRSDKIISLILSGHTNTWNKQRQQLTNIAATTCD